MLDRLIIQEHIHGIKINRGAPSISHQMYADDLVIYCGATAEEASKIKGVMSKFQRWSGLKANTQKSTIHFSKNVHAKLKGEIFNILEFRECNHKSKHLGTPFCKTLKKSGMFQDIIEKVGGKLSGWRRNALSQAGRTILLQSVAQSIPLYISQIARFPGHVCEKIDSKMRNFWWGHKEDGNRHLCLKSWNAICSPKQAGGLGLRRTKDVNTACMAKLAWKVATDKEKSWVRLLASKYLHRGDFLETSRCPTNASGKEELLLLKGLCYKVGNGNTISIWHDPWIPLIGNLTPPSDLRQNCNLNLVSHLLKNEGRNLNVPLVECVFPRNIANAILMIKIPAEPEPDSLIWVPSSSGEFSIKSSYRFLNQVRFTGNSQVPRDTWKHLWSAHLHNRHKFLLWRLCSRILPTVSRLSGIMDFSLTNAYCCFCHRVLRISRTSLLTV